MRPLRLIACAIASTLLVAGCDFVTDHEQDFSPLHGSYDAHDVVYTTPGVDRLEEGWTIGIRFIPDEGIEGLPGTHRDSEFMVIELPPDGEFAPPLITTGTFETLGNGRANLHSLDGVLLDRMEFVDEGTAGMRFDFEGGLGFERIRSTSWIFYNYPYVTGLYHPQEFLLTDAEGESVDLATVSGTNVLLVLEPHWGRYEMTIQAPAGLLAEAPVSLAYNGEFNTVGNMMILRPGLGCDTFAGKATIEFSIEFNGYACDIAGEPYLLNASFR